MTRTISPAAVPLHHAVYIVYITHDTQPRSFSPQFYVHSPLYISLSIISIIYSVHHPATCRTCREHWGWANESTLIMDTESQVTLIKDTWNHGIVWVFPPNQPNKPKPNKDKIWNIFRKRKRFSKILRPHQCPPQK